MSFQNNIRQRFHIAVLPATLLCMGMIWLLSGISVHAVRSADLSRSGSDGGCRSQTFDLITAEDLPSTGPIACPGSGSKKAPGRRGEAETEEYLPLVIITAGFEGQPYDDSYDWNDIIFEQQNSLKQYYKNMSCDKFTFMPVQETSAYEKDGNTNKADKENDGIVHVSLSKPKECGWYVRETNEKQEVHEIVPHLTEILTEAGKYIDFNAYDSNGDGAIQTNELAIGFIIAGNDAADYTAIGNVSRKEEYRFIWPTADSFSRIHRVYSDLPEPPVINNVTIDEFIMIAENKLSSGTAKPSDIGVLSHELGHYLGLPDLYSLRSYGDWDAYNVGFLSLMDSGNYGRDMDGNTCPYSLDIWSRIKLGWVDSRTVCLDEEHKYEASIAGSLTNTEAPLAVRIETGREGEYYLLENRRFAGWDQGMSQDYSSAAAPSEGGEDLGGGLLVWHIDENMYEKYPRDVNGYNHHPSIMPLFPEKKDDVFSLIGDNVVISDPFFDSERWGRDMFLPLYGEKDNDQPADRRQTTDLSLSLDSKSQPLMKVHLHQLPAPVIRWERDYSSASRSCLCYKCFKNIPIETSDDISSEVIKKPSSTEPGIMRYTVQFLTDGFISSTEASIPPLDEETIKARTQALDSLAEIIIEAKRDLSGEYTENSLDDLRKAIDDANAIYNDDTATLEEIKAIRAELVMAWRLLEAKEPSDDPENPDDRSRPDAISNLAKVLADVYATIREEDYKPDDYADFMKICEDAYLVLENPGSTTEELEDALMKVVTARVPFEKNGRIRKAANPLKVKGKNATVRFKKLKKKAQSLPVTKTVVFLKKGEGTMSYKLAGVTKAKYKKYFKVNAKTGKLTIKKGLKKGTYKLKITVTAKGNTYYKASDNMTIVSKIIIK